jgi:hypothetical protein
MRILARATGLVAALKALSRRRKKRSCASWHEPQRLSQPFAID